MVVDQLREDELDRLFGAGATAGMRLPTDVPPPAPAAGESATAAPDAAARPATPAAAVSEEIRTLAAQARDHYQRALDAQRQGNWAQYGEEIKRLGDVLQRMDAARQER